MIEQAVAGEIVLGCVDAWLSEQWYAQGLGLAPAGGRRLPAGTPFAANMLDGEGREAVVWWMVGDNAAFRLALVQFSNPLPQLLPHDADPLDLGSITIGVHIADIDATLARLALQESLPIAPISGSPGNRRVAVRSPDGIIFELREQDLVPGASRANRGTGATVRSLSLTVSDLDQAIAHYCALLGLAPGAPALHRDADEAAWALDGATARRAVFACGEILLELVQYTNRPMRPRPADHRVSDQGVVGFGFFVPAAALGAKTFAKDADGVWSWFAPTPGYQPGFAPRDIVRRPRIHDYKVHRTHLINASPARVWRALNDHDRMAQWIECDVFTLTRHGHPNSAGYGAERLLDAMGRKVLQQVTFRASTRLGYRAIAGTPFAYHNGNAQVVDEAGQCRVTWQIRFRTVARPLGAQIFPQLSRGIGEMLVRLGDMVEAE